MTEYVRICPSCGSARSLDEMVCQNVSASGHCNYPLISHLPVPAQDAEAEEASRGSATDAAVGEQALPRCRNGHELEPGDLLCGICGESVAEEVAPTAGASFRRVLVDKWPEEVSFGASAESDLYLVRRECDDVAYLFKHYRPGVEPNVELYPAIRAIAEGHRPQLMDAGRFEERAFEVWEHFPAGALANVPTDEQSRPEFVHAAVTEIAQALNELDKAGIRHRALTPQCIMLRRTDPVDLVLSSFSNATLAEFDLEASPAPPSSRYAAPETIAGMVAASSDWWSLGVIVMEMLTGGACFEGVHDKAFLLHVVTRGIRVPDHLPAGWRELLMGLLTRDPSLRWTWPQVARWLDGERGIPHGYQAEVTTTDAGPAIVLGGIAYRAPDAFALAAADNDTWDDARDLLLRGAVATWLEELQVDTRKVAELRRVIGDQALNDDARVALALLVLNGNMPLCFRGEIVTPGWLLTHPARAIAWLSSSLPSHLRRLGREAWLIDLRERADRIRSRVSDYAIPVAEEQLEVALLATSTSILTARWHDKRRGFPEALHPGLGMLYDRRSPSDEDLIILVSARIDTLRPADDLLDEASRLAGEANVPEFDPEIARSWFTGTKRAALDMLNERLRGFARCGRERADEWADSLRLERRISFTRMLVLLAIPKSEWREPPQQQYVKNVLTFFHRRLVTNLQRGPLVRLLISRTAARLDLQELGAEAKPASTLLEAVLGRTGKMTDIAPAALLSEPIREQRLRRLKQSADTFRRDTGINALYMGFPLLVMREGRRGETTRPRIAPVLLWPVSVDIPPGIRGRASIAFDRDRNEVRVNPAFEAMLGAEETAKWQAAADELLSRDGIRPVDVLGVLGTLATAEGTALRPVPKADFNVAPGETLLRCSAAIFLCDFSGQALAEDLKHIASRPVKGTVLEVAIRAARVETEAKTAVVPEHDRYFTVEADPSQQAAVFLARQQPGLVIQGPPGTGKSQTIVNIIGDSIGRGERVLVVCQKQAALEVVRKRLAAERLDSRLLMIEDTFSDRRPILLALREQLDKIWSSNPSVTGTAQVRQDLARRVETVEAAINESQRALHYPDPGCGSSYREVIERLLTIEAGKTAPFAAPALRSLLRPLRPADVEEICDATSPLAALWLGANFEDSPLHNLQSFGADESMAMEFRAAFYRLVAAEGRRKEVLAQPWRFYDIEVADPLAGWLAKNEAALRSITESVAQDLARWFDLLHTSATGEAAASRFVESLQRSLVRLECLDLADHDERISPHLANMADTEVNKWARTARSLLAPAGWLAAINPFCALRRKRMRKLLAGLSLTPEPATLGAVLQAALLEIALRPERAAAAEIRAKLSVSVIRNENLLELRRSTAATLVDLRAALEAMSRVETHPLADIGVAVARKGKKEGYQSWLDTCRSTLLRLAARQESEKQLDALAAWIKPSWRDELSGAIREHRSADDQLTRVADALPTLESFQRFRVRAANLGEMSLRAFATLHAYRDALQALPSETLSTELGRTLRREALLAWKDRIEAESPALLIERAELEEKVRTLAELDRQLRHANRDLLSTNPPASQMAARRDWEDVYLLQGPRARRLREVVELGARIGIFRLRPIWLCSPEMVSRLFPLSPGIFDVVVFDEASQLPIEASLAAMFRAKRVVVSGDEKQMPPTNFFNSRLEVDEEHTSDDWLESEDDHLDETTRRQREEAANRKEVKDCTDLLELAKTCLPVATLEIHYRSKYRELVAFSNSAFYRNQLSVPARHPVAEVRRARPIEVIRTGTEYFNQTNPGEARCVVECLNEIWTTSRAEERPSLGVVTFNLKQADLIQDAIEQRAEESPEFRLALEQELQRAQNGEDMSFFVKNLENVQGDERDWIVFSTTFGPDARGSFRRNFGVVGQHGGERRLNVAVTRAREKVVLVTSMPVAKISSFLVSRRSPQHARDFLQAYLDYAEKLSRGELNLAQGALLALGPNNNYKATNEVANGRFRDEVREFIASRGFDPVPGTDVDVFALDFAIEDPRTGLFGVGIECDPPTHPLLNAARARELWRPRVLKSAVPHVHRVWSRTWYHDRQLEQQHLMNAIELALGV